MANAREAVNPGKTFMRVDNAPHNTSSQLEESEASYNHIGRGSVRLATIGGSAGAAFLGGTLTGPIGAVFGTLVGLTLGYFLSKRYRYKRQPKAVLRGELKSV